jgi:hypothetical protein
MPPGSGSPIRPGRRPLAVALLVALVAATLVSIPSLPAAAAGPAPDHSYGGAHDAGSRLVRQCLPGDAAPVAGMPAIAAAAILQLDADVIAAVASERWIAIPGPSALVHRDTPAPPSPAPPRGS